MVTRIRTYVFAVTESSEEKLSWLQELAKGCGVEISSEPAAAVTAKEIKDETVLFSGWLEKMVCVLNDNNFFRLLIFFLKNNHFFSTLQGWIQWWF